MLVINILGFAFPYKKFVQYTTHYDVYKFVYSFYTLQRPEIQSNTKTNKFKVLDIIA